MSILTMLAASLMVGCTDASSPSLGFQLRTEVAPQSVSAGDTVMLRAIMTNPGRRSIDIGVSCGPPVFFEIQRPDSGILHPIPLDAVFTCDHRDVHTLGPGETDTVSFRWAAAALRGEYAVRSGRRAAGGGLEFLTKPASVQVR